VSSPVTSFVGWSPTDRVPGYYAESLFAQGAISAGSLTKKCLVTGTKIAAGTATASQDINQIFSMVDADAYYGAGSEINLQCLAALSVPGVTLWGAPCAEAVGATAGTITVTFATPPTSAGTYFFWINGFQYSFSVTSSDTVTTTALAFVNALKSNPRAPCTGVPTAGVVALTTVSKGGRTGDNTLYISTQFGPTAMTCVISGGGTALTSGPNTLGAHFTAGTGVETLATLLTLLFPGTWDYIGAAQYDAANVVLWKTQVENKAGIVEGRLEQFTVGSTTSLATTTTLGQTTLNETRASVVWLNDGESTPSCIAANVAALRSVTEGANPVAIYDGVNLAAVVPNRFSQDIPTHAQQVSAINNSVTPIVTVNSQATIGMLITSYSLFGANPDYRCLQTYYVSMADYARIDIGLGWLSAIKPNNPRVQDNPSSAQPQPPAGVSTPARILSYLFRKANFYQAQGWFTNVAGNPPQAGYNATAKRIECIFPCPITAGNHQLGVSVRQLASPYPTVG